MLNECPLCMNDILNYIYSYGVSEDQFYFIVKLIKSLYHKTDFFKHFDMFEKNKEDLCLQYTGVASKLVICYDKKYFSITISDGKFICNISKFRKGKEVLINLCSTSDKENFFYQIGENAGVLYYYDEAAFNKANLLMGDDFLFLPRRPKEVEPKTTYYFSLNDSFDNMVEYFKCITESSLKTAVTYTNENGEIKVL